MKRRILNRTERDIIRVLFMEGRMLSINEIAELSGISWATVKKHLRSVVRKRIALENREERRPKYHLNDDLILAIYEMRQGRP